MNSELEQMEFQELKTWLDDRMHMRGSAAADTDRRTDEAPYDRPLSVWNAADEPFRKTLVRCVRELLREAQKTPWEAEYLHNLLTLVEEGEMEAVADTLSDIAHSRAWFEQEDGSRLHMLALRTLLGLGRKQTPEFWMRENRRVGGLYPELTFRGLISHGLDEAFDRLPQVATDVESAEEISRLFPRLIEQHGLETIRGLVRETLPHATADVSEYLSQWFPKWDYGAGLLEEGTPERGPSDDWEPQPEHFSVAGVNEKDAQADPGWRRLVGHRPRPLPENMVLEPIPT